jgi:cold shock CspA family protein
MQVPPEITLKNISMTPLVDKLITRGIDGLEKIHGSIISARISLEQAQGRRQSGNPLRMRIDIRIPDRPDIVVERLSKGIRKAPGSAAEPELDQIEEPDTEGTGRPVRSPAIDRKKREEPIEALIRRAFDSAKRELGKTVQKQRGDVKTPAQQGNTAVIEKLLRDQQFGFLRTLDGQQVYFHRNSVLHRHWDRLTIGAAVRFTPEMGEKGLQASTVELLAKPGAAESHSDLHDLPVVVTPAPAKKPRRRPATNKK